MCVCLHYVTPSYSSGHHAHTHTSQPWPKREKRSQRHTGTRAMLVSLNARVAKPLKIGIRVPNLRTPFPTKLNVKFVSVMCKWEQRGSCCLYWSSCMGFCPSNLSGLILYLCTFLARMVLANRDCIIGIEALAIYMVSFCFGRGAIFSYLYSI